MKTKFQLFAVLVVAFVAPLFAQGPLTPPGAPAPTMKSLAQIEARTPISSAPFTISSPGSYYLTNNLSVSSGDAITIAASGVTLDLNGFTISSTAPGATGTGILISGNRRNITISNGFIEGGVIRSGGVFSGNGFANGIFFSNQGPENMLVSRVSVAGVRVEGIDLGTGESTFVESCHARIIGGTGIVAGVVRDCVVRECGTDGVIGISVENCSALVTGSGTGIRAIHALNCGGTSFSGGKGVDAYSASNCRGIAFGIGTGINAVTASDCTGSSDTSTGVNANTALNCYGTSTSGNAVIADAAQNCHGTSSSGTGDGVFARNSALNCYGSSVGGIGVNASAAQNCVGTSSNYRGVDANTAQNCIGISNSSTGLYADVVNNCYGTSVTSTGLRFGLMGAMCYGARLNPSAANYVLGGGLAGPINLP